MRDRLEKFLGMLGSDFDGERANAAGFIAKMARERKQTIVELMESTFGRIDYKAAAEKARTGTSSWGAAWRNANPPPREETAEDVYQRWDDRRPKYNAGRKSRRTRGKSSDDIISQLSDVQHHECLTDWEHLFVLNVTSNWNSEYDLSKSQRDVAEKILSKCRYHDEHQTGAGWWPGDES